MKKKHTNKYNSGHLRIISGNWRGKKIIFPKDLAIRPTSDQTRETLFNWLNPYIKDSICLDLFAGSGALGLEALSRGAKKVVAIEQNKEIIQHLAKTIEKFDTNAIQIIHLCIPNNLGILTEKFDIIFIDPPFYKNLLASSIKWLINENLLHPKTLIYLEQEKDLVIKFPSNWLELRTKYTLQTKYQLMQVN